MKSRNDRLKGIRILFEDPYLLVVDKPAGMLTTHTKVVGRAAREAQLTAANVLTDYLRKGQWKSSKRAYLVHRLDRETSGVMMFAKEERLAEALREHWNETTEKTYLALVEGAMPTESGIFESYLKENDDGYRVKSVRPETPGAKRAKTEWKIHESVDLPDSRSAGSSIGCTGAQSGQKSVVPFGNQFTLVEVKLHSGRKNQIRVHFSEAGHPVAGDEKYGARKAKRMFLHSLRLKFVHPVTKKTLEFEAKCDFERGAWKSYKD